jgi:hypothetical protein
MDSMPPPMVTSDQPDHDAHGAQGDGFQARGAKTVDRGAGHLVRKAGDLGRVAADVEPLLGFGKGAADHHVVDILGIELGYFLHRCFQNKGEQIQRQGVFEGPFGPLAAGRPDRTDDISFFHGIPSRKMLGCFARIVFRLRGV